jgi:hypothetical protein
MSEAMLPVNGSYDFKELKPSRDRFLSYLDKYYSRDVELHAR